LARIGGVLFLVSSAFPVAAGLSHDTSAFPNWWGIVDVGLAFVVVIFAFAIASAFEGRVDDQVKQTTYRAYRVLLHGILALIVVFFLFGDHIVWLNCITGFGWRSWLLLYALPYWLAALKSPTTEGDLRPEGGG
jgi:hypothetical protein